MDTIQYLSKPALLTEMKRLIQKSLPIKGTYIKTLDQDIFDEQVTKTTELYPVKVGKQQVLVPLVKEEDLAEGAIPEDMINKILAKIKDPKGRAIIREYIEQEKEQKVEEKKAIKAEKAEVKEGDEEAELKKRKDDIVKQMKQANSIDEFTKVLEDNNFEEFKKELQEVDLKYTLAGLTKTYKSIKKRLEDEQTVAAQRKQLIEQALKKKNDEKLAKQQQKEEEKKEKARLEKEEKERARLEKEAKEKEKARLEKEEKERARLEKEAKEKEAKEKELQANKAHTRQQTQEAIKTVLKEDIKKFMEALDNSKMTAKSGMNKFLRVQNYTEFLTELERNGLVTEKRALEKIINERTAKLT